MKSLGIFLTIFSSLAIIMSIIFTVISNYRYENEIGSYWSLADKSSTVIKKSENIDKFVDALESSGLNGKYNAIYLKTPDNSFDMNFEALKTLQQRLREIKNMDVTSFEYNTAIDQITAQEQGEANELISIFKGIWYKENYILLWDWIAFSQIVFFLAVFILGLIFWINY